MYDFCQLSVGSEDHLNSAGNPNGSNNKETEHSCLKKGRGALANPPHPLHLLAEMRKSQSRDKYHSCVYSLGNEQPKYEAARKNINIYVYIIVYIP